MNDNYKVGDTIIIDNPKLKTHNRVGKVIAILPNNLIKVELENKSDYVETCNYKESSLKLHNSSYQINRAYDYKKDGFVVELNFLGNKFKPYKSIYFFKAYDNTIKINDYVLCYTSIGLRIAVVSDILSNDESKQYLGYFPKKDIICKLDNLELEKYISSHNLGR